MLLEKHSSARDYGIAFALGFGTLFLTILYLFLRRGYFDAHIINKAVATTAVILLILVFLTGPLARYFEKWDSWVGYRKEIGIVAGILALAHALITFVFYPT